MNPAIILIASSFGVARAIAELSHRDFEGVSVCVVVDQAAAQAAQAEIVRDCALSCAATRIDWAPEAFVLESPSWEPVFSLSSGARFVGLRNRVWKPEWG